jgi:hypothetical protein
MFVNQDEGHPKMTGILNLLLFIKLFLGLNQFKDMRILFRLVKEVAKDMIPFSYFTIMALIMVATTFYHLSTDVNNIGIKFEDESIFTSLLNVYLITFGEYSYDEYKLDKWSLFIFSTILLSLIMLNLLIAIMSDTFEKVMSEVEESDGLELNALIIDAELF